MKKKILIVDDNQNISKSLEIRMKAAGYDTIVAFDGDEGLRMAREQKPDLILLDVLMPKLDGFTMCRLLKFDSAYEKIPIILLTAKNQSKDVQIGKDIAADAYVVKPFNWPSLLALVEQFLKGEAQSSGAPTGRQKRNRPQVDR
jgi:DNA-binding response OmpR family regulator